MRELESEEERKSSKICLRSVISQKCWTNKQLPSAFTAGSIVGSESTGKREKKVGTVRLKKGSGTGAEELHYYFKPLKRG